MFKTIFCLIAVLLLCSSCVSRTVYKKEVSTNGEKPKQMIEDKKIIWIWNKDY